MKLSIKLIARLSLLESPAGVRQLRLKEVGPENGVKQKHLIATFLVGLCLVLPVFCRARHVLPCQSVVVVR